MNEKAPIPISSALEQLFGAPKQSAVPRKDLVKVLLDISNQLHKKPLLSELRTTFIPPHNIIRTADAFYIEVAVPGYTKDQINISTENGIIRINTNITEEEKTDYKGEYIIEEFGLTPFSIDIKLPDHTKPSDITANLKDGILTVTINRPVELKHNQIPIGISTE